MKSLDNNTYATLKAEALSSVRGTVQADILKEDQAQNTCIFSTEFALRLMGDVQDHFIRSQRAEFLLVSISGYHIAEAGANPITQLAFTLPTDSPTWNTTSAAGWTSTSLDPT